jgi:hypothetical protein
MKGWVLASPDSALQRTVTDKVLRHIDQRAAAEPERYTTANVSG